METGAKILHLAGPVGVRAVIAAAAAESGVVQFTSPQHHLNRSFPILSDPAGATFAIIKLNLAHQEPLATKAAATQPAAPAKPKKK